MTYYAVVDTNVLVSSMLKGSSIPGVIVSKVLDGPIVPLLNEEFYCYTERNAGYYRRH